MSGADLCGQKEVYYSNDTEVSGGHAKSWVFLKNMMYRDTAFHLLPLASFSTQLVISEQQVKTMLENFILLDAVFISLYEGAGSYLVSSLFY